jgi:hypothetical protein
VAPYSPVALPGYRVGQTPTNSGRRLSPEIQTPNEPNESHALLCVPSLRAPTGIRNEALRAIFSLPTTAVYLGYLYAIALQNWSSP